MNIAWVYDKGRPSNWVSRAFEGSPLGGSEASMWHYARTFVELGHDVTIFTPGTLACEREGVKWHDLRGIHGHEFDVAIALRFPNALPSFRASLRVLYCCDPAVKELPEFVNAGHVNLVITISQYQKDLFQKLHPIPEELYMVSNAGIVYSDYLNKDVKKVRGRCIYCSAPPRGLGPLVKAWPLIQEKVPYATLHVTGGFELWGMDTKLAEQPLGKALLELEGAEYLGTVSRERLIQEQLEAEVMLLPGKTDSPEMCCISAMECQAAGCLLLVGSIGALPERVDNGWAGVVCPVEGLSVKSERFASQAASTIRAASWVRQWDAAKMVKAVAKYDYSVLAPQWLERFEKELNA